MSFVQSASTDTAAAVAFGSAVGQGDALFAWVWCTSTGSATATCADSVNTGNWSLLIGPVTNGTATGWLFAFNGTKAGTPTVTTTLTGTILTNSVRIAEYSSVSGYDVSASGTSTASTTLTTSNLVTRFNAETIVASNFDPSSTTWSVGSGYTQRGTASATLGLILEDKSVTAPGTYTATMTPTVSSTAIIIAVALYAALPVVWDEPTKLKTTMGALAIAGVAFAAPSITPPPNEYEEWAPPPAKIVPVPKPTPFDAPVGFNATTAAILPHFVEWSPPTKPVPVGALTISGSGFGAPSITLPGLSGYEEWSPTPSKTTQIQLVSSPLVLGAQAPLALDEFVEWAPSSKPNFFRAFALDQGPQDALVQPTIPASSGWQEWGGKGVKPSAPRSLDHVPIDDLQVAFVATTFPELAPLPRLFVPPRATSSDASAALDPLPFAPGQSFIEWAPSTRPFAGRFFSRDEGALDELTQGSALDHFVEWSPSSKPTGIARSFALDAAAALDPLAFAPGQSFIEWAPSSIPRRYSVSVLDYLPTDGLVLFPILKFLEWGTPAKIVPVPRPTASDAHVLDDSLVPPTIANWNEWAPNQRVTYPPRLFSLDITAPFDPLAFAPGQSFIEWSPSSKPLFFKPFAADATAYQDPLPFAPSQSFIEWAPSSFPRRYSTIALDHFPVDTQIFFSILKFLEWTSPAKIVSVPKPTSFDAHVLDDVLLITIANWNEWAPNQRTFSPPRVTALDAPAALDPLSFAPGQSFIEWASPSKVFTLHPLAYDAHLALDPLSFAPAQSFIEWAVPYKPIVSPRLFARDELIFDKGSVTSLGWFDWAPLHQYAPIWRKANDAIPIDDRYIPPPPTEFLDWAPISLRPFRLVRIVDSSAQLIGLGIPLVLVPSIVVLSVSTSLQMVTIATDLQTGTVATVLQTTSLATKPD